MFCFRFTCSIFRKPVWWVESISVRYLGHWAQKRSRFQNLNGSTHQTVPVYANFRVKNPFPTSHHVYVCICSSWLYTSLLCEGISPGSLVGLTHLPWALQTNNICWPIYTKNVGSLFTTTHKVFTPIYCNLQIIFEGNVSNSWCSKRNHTYLNALYIRRCFISIKQCQSTSKKTMSCDCKTNFLIFFFIKLDQFCYFLYCLIWGTSLVVLPLDAKKPLFLWKPSYHSHDSTVPCHATTMSLLPILCVSLSSIHH